jgi:hypothetical protein
MAEVCFQAVTPEEEMNEAAPLGIFIASAVLFLLPCSLLGVAWRRAVKSGQDLTQPNWRIYCIKAALLVASFATFASIAFIFSWLHNGGSPHGLGPSPGLWKHLGPVFTWTLVVSVVLATLGKGKGATSGFGMGTCSCFCYGNGLYAGHGLTRMSFFQSCR